MTVDASQDVNLSLGRIAARLARHLDVVLAEVELSDAQYRILIFLDEGGAAASAIAERLAVTRPSVTAVVDGLVSRGLVERRPAEDDRRRIDHLLTEEGVKVLRAADKAAEDHFRCIADHGRKPAALVAGLVGWREGLDAHFAAAVQQHEQNESKKAAS